MPSSIAHGFTKICLWGKAHHDRIDSGISLDNEYSDFLIYQLKRCHQAMIFPAETTCHKPSLTIWAQGSGGIENGIVFISSSCAAKNSTGISGVKFWNSFDVVTVYGRWRLFMNRAYISLKYRNALYNLRQLLRRPWTSLAGRWYIRAVWTRISRTLSRETPIMPRLASDVGDICAL